MRFIPNIGLGKPLEDRILKLLDEAISLMPKKGEAIELYSSEEFDYMVDERFDNVGIIRYSTGKYPNGDPVTKSNYLTTDAFLGWLKKQPCDVQGQVYQNLSDYINTPIQQSDGGTKPYKSVHDSYMI